jgi:hypothetical protein
MPAATPNMRPKAQATNSINKSRFTSLDRVIAARKKVLTGGGLPC